MIRFVLILLLGLAPGCVPVGVMVGTAIWHNLAGRAGCVEAMKDPNFEARMKNPKHKEYFESMCGEYKAPPGTVPQK